GNMVHAGCHDQRIHTLYPDGIVSLLPQVIRGHGTAEPFVVRASPDIAQIVEPGGQQQPFLLLFFQLVEAEQFFSTFNYSLGMSKVVVQIPGIQLFAKKGRYIVLGFFDNFRHGLVLNSPNYKILDSTAFTMNKHYLLPIILLLFGGCATYEAKYAEPFVVSPDP